MKTSLPATLIASLTPGLRPGGDRVELESHWRRPVDENRRAVRLARWTRHLAEPEEVTHGGHDTVHCVGINLKSTSLRFEHADAVLFDGRVMPGAIQVTTPRVATRACFHCACDVLHLFVSAGCLSECYQSLFDEGPSADVLLDDPRVRYDPVIERLALALVAAQAGDIACGAMFVDAVGLAIVSRLVAHRFEGMARRAHDAALPGWRMRRVAEYVEAHLSEPIELVDMAGSAGLTRMQFAAQFRRATGLRPHEYLLKRRIERAQTLLVTSKLNVLDVALACGFRSQAHFTMVFRRFVGDTPHRWRIRATSG
ncbi:helix-turn-helix transcriptional regulator [Paraburkholderia sp. LEh10]|uniref:AraC family transcriptional regulator n=1 Tax=Paraburkholderia sp. LEh10 TaxID=2821353 RepID=UPI001AE2080F|nr:AraC family transcriptional regulator [Paraburkholderia sp. LEh10]MBP0593008.1 helix-turn-helix transcriptional regulator [Paraburkholderia sp. LEh10]